jgi:hypothetical protein
MFKRKPRLIPEGRGLVQYARAPARTCVCVCVCVRERERERERKRERVVYRVSGGSKIKSSLLR